MPPPTGAKVNGGSLLVNPSIQKGWGEIRKKCPPQLLSNQGGKDIFDRVHKKHDHELGTPVTRCHKTFRIKVMSGQFIYRQVIAKSRAGTIQQNFYSQNAIVTMLFRPALCQLVFKVMSRSDLASLCSDSIYIQHSLSLTYSILLTSTRSLLCKNNINWHIQLCWCFGTWTFRFPKSTHCPEVGISIISIK